MFREIERSDGADNPRAASLTTVVKLSAPRAPGEPPTLGLTLQSQSTATPAGAGGVIRVALSDVLSSRIQMHWFEVIAIAQGVCEAFLRATDGREPTTVPLHHLVLTSLGNVEITAGPRGADSPVVMVRQILDRGLPANKPVQLRLLQLEIGAPAYSGTLKQLTTALDYFERPGRSDLIRAVVERYVAQRPVAPMPEETEPHKTPPERASRFDLRRVGRVGVAAVLILAAVAAVGSAVSWVARRHVLGVPRAGSQSVSTAIAATQSAVGNRLQALAEGLGLVVSPTTRRQLDATDRTKATAVKEASGRRRPRGAEAVSAPPSTPAGADHQVVAEAPPRRSGGRSDPLPLARGAKGSADVASHDDGHETDALVYDKTAQDVTPPTELWPRYAHLPANTPPGEIAVFDLIVDEAGHVASARARIPLKRWDHIMLLSAMKAWRFEPATKNGHPVRFRKEVLVRVPGYTW